MKPIALVLAAASSFALLTTTPALADHRGISQQEMVQKFMRIFDRLDRNNSGAVSRKWIRRLEGRNNHNDGPRIGVVFGDENFRIAFGTGGGRHRGGRGYIGPINSRTFHIYDLNNDRVIRRKELRRAVKQEFRGADRNGDGFLNQRELNKSNWYRSATHRGHARYYPDYRRDRRDRRDGHRDRHRDGRRDGHRDGRRDGHRDGRRDGHRDGRRDGHHDGRRDGRRDGHRDKHRDGRRDGHRDRKHNDSDRTRDRKHNDGDRTRDRDRKETRDRDRDRNRD